MTQPLHLNDTDKKRLLQIARDALTSYLTQQPMPEVLRIDASLMQQSPLFVTLWKRDKTLRGCVGRVEDISEPLYQLVQQCAIAAATRDYRFPPVTAAELDDLLIEISVLSPPEKIARPEDVEVGRHGLLIRQERPERRAGLLLPQVATGRGWDREQFLRAVCQKAFLPPDAWRTADLYVFETEVFEEEP